MDKSSSRIEKYVTKKGLCTGCGICSALFKDKIDIEMKESGFYRPFFLESLSKSELQTLEQICPALNMKGSVDSDLDSPLMGKHIDSKVGWSMSEKIRYLGSSGGALSAFLLYLLEKEKIDGVIHVGRGTIPLTAEGKLSTTPEEVLANTGSAYMPVALLKNLKSMLDKVDKVALVGKGCDIRAAKRFIELNPEYKSKVLVFIGILCGGSPSINGTYQILNDFGIKKEEIKSFRYRGNGWPGSCTAITNNNTEHKMSYNDAWAKKLGPTSPLVCKLCFDGIAESADIVFGDAWKCEKNNYPSFEETDGRNLIICRTEDGKKLLDEAVSSSYIELSDEFIGDSEFNIIQPSQSNRRYLAKYKLFGLKMIGFSYPTVDFKQLSWMSELSGIQLSLLTKLRTMLGSVKRARRASKAES